MFRFDLDPPGFEPPPPGGCFECEDDEDDGGTAGAWGRLGMVVVNPVEPPPAVLGVTPGGPGAVRLDADANGGPPTDAPAGAESV